MPPPLPPPSLRERNWATATATVSTLAGNGTPGFADGQGTNAEFFYPCGVAVDGAGNVYVADCDNNCIRKVSPSGLVSTLAGKYGGYADGQGTDAAFGAPAGVVVDGAGNLYVADDRNNRIRKVSSSGLVSTLAGSGIAGYADGQGILARFNRPLGVALDSTGSYLYVVEYMNVWIRRVNTASGLVSTYTSNAFGSLRGVAVDADGIVYLADQSGNSIQVISLSGSVSTLRFTAPCGVAVDSVGNLWVADTSSNSIRVVVKASSSVIVLAGNGSALYADGQGTTSASFNTPIGIAVDAAGNAFVADTLNHRIRALTFS